MGWGRQRREATASWRQQFRGQRNALREGRPRTSYSFHRFAPHYVDWGNEEAPPTLLVHSGRYRCRNWDWVAQEFKADYHTIVTAKRHAVTAA